MAGIGSGDPTASTRLHAVFSERVFFIALRELRSREDAEDVRNETLMRVMVSIRAGRLASSEALPAYVLNTAHNVIREVIRKNQRSESVEERDFPAPSVAVPDHGVQKAIQKVIAELKPRERDFLRLYYFEELPKEQISEKLGIHEDRVRLIKSRALKSFREVYQRLKIGV